MRQASLFPNITCLAARPRWLACPSPATRAALGILLALGMTGGLAADAPVPPTPDEATAEVQPAAFTPAAEGLRGSGPLPLTGGSGPERPAARPATPLRPFGDWTVLVAIAAAFALVGVFRLGALRRGRSLPSDVFELLGEAPLGGQQTVRVVRFGPRTLLLGVSSSGCHTLAELDDAQATERIVAACRKDPGGERRAPRGPRQRPAGKPADGEAT